VGEWGARGEGPGLFTDPIAAAIPTDARVYVADLRNARVQYFGQDNPAVVPASLGKVKALFR
jgi:hypothetical protein